MRIDWQYTELISWHDSDEFDEDEINDEDLILDEISLQVQSLWFRYPWWKHVRDVASQWQYIQPMRTKYVFPDYLSLVGEPTERDFTDRGGLTTKRQAELLLIRLAGPHHHPADAGPCHAVHHGDLHARGDPQAQGDPHGDPPGACGALCP